LKSKPLLLFFQPDKKAQPTGATRHASIHRGYTDHFRLADDYIAHLDVVLGSSSDPFVQSRYTGFLAVSTVTVYELTIKTIFREFAQGKHKVLGNFADAYFDRINGKIRLSTLRGEYIKKFGEKYIKRFDRRLAEKENEILRKDGESVKSSYENIITWRNDFAHGGNIPATPTYEEVKRAYTFGKHVLHCLAGTMNR
jgi:hypothetical protein